MQPYPTFKVIISYPLLGGMMGGLLLSPVLLLPISVLSDRLMIEVLFIMLVSAIVGFIPALLTGIVLAYFEVRIYTIIDYFKAFGVGFGITFLIFFWRTNV